MVLTRAFMHDMLDINDKIKLRDTVPNLCLFKNGLENVRHIMVSQSRGSELDS